jgi:hypothetical protein
MPLSFPKTRGGLAGERREFKVTVKKPQRTSGLPSVAAALLVGLLALTSCETGTGLPTITGVTNSQIAVTVDPSPIVATQNTATKAVTAKFAIKIQELNGLGCEVTFVSAAVYDPTTGAELSLVYFDGNDLVVFVGTKRIEAKATLSVPETLSYVLADGSKAASVSVAVQVKDDRGNLINRSLLAKIQ